MKERYLGIKIVNAEPMDEQAFAVEAGRPKPGVNRAGYKVVYEDGYTSWSPKSAFEKAYRKVSDSDLDQVRKWASVSRFLGSLFGSM